jgi:hypothetical protein
LAQSKLASMMAFAASCCPLTCDPVSLDTWGGCEAGAESAGDFSATGAAVWAFAGVGVAAA